MGEGTARGCIQADIATQSVTDDESNLPQMLSDLGFTLVAHAASAEDREAVDPRVVEEAVQVLRRFMDLTPAESASALAGRLERLAGALLLRVPGAGDDRPQVAGEAVAILERLLALTPPEDPQRPKVLLRLAEALLAANRPAEMTDLLVQNEAAFPAGSSEYQAATPLLYRAAILRVQIARDSDPEWRASQELHDEFMGPAFAALGGNPSGGSGHPLAAILKLLGFGDRPDQSRHADLIRFATELLQTPDDIFAMPGLITKAMQVISHRFDDLPPGERAEALAEYMRSLPQQKDAGRATAEHRTPVDTGVLDELLESLRAFAAGTGARLPRALRAAVPANER